MPFTSINPYTRSLIRDHETLLDTDIQRLIQDAHYQFTIWSKTSMQERSAYLHTLADLIDERASEYALDVTREMGKPYVQAKAEVQKCALLCRYFADEGPKMLETRELESSGKKAYVRYEPLGVILGITPWNYPFWQAFRFGIPTLMAGNACLLKPAPNVAISALNIDALFQEVFGTLNPWKTILVEVDQIPEVINNVHVKGLALTGSDKAGAAVSELAGRAIKKSVLELGGSDAFIVLEDADVKNAARMAVKSRMNNSGQTCICAKRLIVHESVYDQFVNHLKAIYRDLVVGDPMDRNTNISALARPDLADLLMAQVHDALDKGASWIIPGTQDTENPGIIYPGLLTGITSDMRAYHEELFGPIAMIFKVKNAAEAIQLANDSPYGLGANVWTNDPAKALEVAAQLQAGAVAINGMVRSDPKLPFGGIKRSGFGRELGPEGIRSFVNIKSIVVH